MTEASTYYERLNNQKAKRGHVHLLVTSMNDDDFLWTFHNDPQVANFVRDHILGAAIREENILRSKETRQSTTREKELSLVTETGNRENIVQYIHTLDDFTLLTLAKNPSIQKILEETPSLYQRYLSVHVHEHPRDMSSHIRDHLSLEEGRLVFKTRTLKEHAQKNRLSFSLFKSSLEDLKSHTSPDSPYCSRK